MNLKNTALTQSRRAFFKLSSLVVGAAAVGAWGNQRVTAQTATPPATPEATGTSTSAGSTPSATGTSTSAQSTPSATSTSASAASTPAATGTVTSAETATPGFVLPPLPYAYDALEAVIDTETMTLHHDKHHADYVAALNSLLADSPNLLALSPEQLVRGLARVPRAIRVKVRNNGGGHLNHSLFWQMMKPGGSEPTGALADAINTTFTSLELFKNEFETAGQERFGSGFVWLVKDRRNRLSIISTPNQDNPLMAEYGGLTPVLGNDVWEHAYYLRYRNGRKAYLNAWWQVVNWDFAGQQFAA